MYGERVQIRMWNLLKGGCQSNDTETTRDQKESNEQFPIETLLYSSSPGHHRKSII